MFNSSPISPLRCRRLLTKIALLLFTGEKFPTNEATSLFFGISKLFQNKDASLRQMVYLVIKELANTAEDVIMVTSSIMKDTAVGSDILYRANAIRALCRIIDVSPIIECRCCTYSNMIRPQLCRPLSDSSRPQLWTKHLQFPLQLWSLRTISCQLQRTLYAGGRARHKKLHLRPNHRVDSLLVFRLLGASIH